ncbi:alpha/beta-hydrolase [Stereum hirsutum FP-91666 SS1]|uniref:Alpha/beta-hydrolase n=1 Tax=Stereum hirsutum (strain FP-91666) TaxID=721885 RepID=R7RY22_STEHR|nr:alpha/beta-hydrolase [Stereum hirsutum FP-91666 SS1]EIM80306.1 alpha/beta-hydrolase [Stereum hirsutum FP-91666 SS1]
MLSPSVLIQILVLLAPAVVSVPLSDRSSGNSASTTAVSNATIDDDFVRPAQFSRIAYCSSAAVEAWNCGAPCQALGMNGVTPLVVGGDGGQTPRFFVSHDNKTQSIVVAHQGTDSSNVLSIINDAEFLDVGINTTLFPNAGSNVSVHDGFGKAQARTAQTILSTVQSGLSTYNVSKVLITGHSLGAAIATMDAVMLRMQLPTSVEMNTVVFGAPRGGNEAWADLVDATLGGNFTYITHKDDPVPLVPPQFLGYVHPSGEVHIVATDDASGNATQTISCPGRENENCSDGNSLLASSVSDHLGPYFANVSMSGSSCPL